MGRLFINDTVHSRPQQRGVARFADKAIEALVAAFSDRVTVLSTHPRAYGAARHLTPLHWPGRLRLNFLLRDSLASLAAWSERARVLFSPYYGNARVRAAEVHTVYDMIYELYPHYFSRSDPRIRSFVGEKRECIERAACVIAISASTAEDLLACYPKIDAAKIKVIPLGVDEFFLLEPTSPPSPPSQGRPYFLYVGQRGGYKNFSRLLKAFQLSGLAGDWELLVLSPSRAGFDTSERGLLRAYGLQQSVRLIGDVPDAALRSYYQGACALVYPSEHEGFGLPILEAMASGTLVLTSPRASMPEVGGTAAFYADPYSEEALAAGLTMLAHLPEDHRRLHIEAGRRRARAYSWQRCQSALVDLVQQML